MFLSRCTQTLVPVFHLMWRTLFKLSFDRVLVFLFWGIMDDKWSVTKSSLVGSLTLDTLDGTERELSSRIKWKIIKWWNLYDNFAFKKNNPVGHYVVTKSCVRSHLTIYHSPAGDIESANKSSSWFRIRRTVLQKSLTLTEKKPLNKTKKNKTKPL